MERLRRLAAHCKAGPESGTRPGLVALCGAILVVLIAPVLLVIPLAYNNEPYIRFPIHEYSLPWFADLFGNPVWLSAIANGLATTIPVTLLATSLGTLTAVGLNHQDLPGKRMIMPVLIAPMIVPVVVLAVGAYFFFSRLGIANNLLGIVLVHVVLGMCFVLVIFAIALSLTLAMLRRRSVALRGLDEG